jgi:hypothetical protein
MSFKVHSALIKNQISKFRETARRQETRKKALLFFAKRGRGHDGYALSRPSDFLDAIGSAEPAGRQRLKSMIEKRTSNRIQATSSTTMTPIIRGGHIRWKTLRRRSVVRLDTGGVDVAAPSVVLICYGAMKIDAQKGRPVGVRSASRRGAAVRQPCRTSARLA